MEDTNQNIMTKPQPAVLDIKPVEHLEKVVEVKRPEPPEEEMEDLKDDDIFIKPQKEVKKKKKVLSERQKAHMEKMRLARKKKLEEKNKSKPKKAEPKPPPKTEVREPQQNFTGHGGNMSNQEYMKQFFNNMNMFMDSYNKLNEVKAKRPTSNPQPIPEKDDFKDMKPKKQVKPKAQPKNTDCSYSIDFLKPKVGYNYKNPFGF